MKHLSLQVRVLHAWWVLIGRHDLFPPWSLAQYDRIFTDRHGTRHILDGSQGHSWSFGAHHGPRQGCPVCREDPRVDTDTLPRRFR